MALSQLQCLDDNHVNPRTHESKPEFLYCEDQRLALEAFLRDGREEFVKYLGAHSLRGFLSDPELETLSQAVEPYDPGSELFFPENAEEDEPPLSLHYWPELSDTSVPQMDLSWPDNISYRGVTRTSVYTQPPLEGQVHIKEVVRKMIAQAQKVIAVVMDVFTDVDIFRDLLDAGFRRKVSVYILLERTTLPHFQSMCQRANMHTGHLKNLRVRCTDGAEFYTRSCTKVRGQMGHRFMFIDGDKAVSGSYSFTWTSSRLDKNLITVVTGQAVEAFDRLFCVLYGNSTSVDLRQVAAETEPEPEVEPLPQPVPVTTSADMARKLYSPKYAMLGLASPSPTPAAGPKDTLNPQNSKNPETKKERRKRVSKEAIQEDPPLHPGLTNLEKACMMSYLPTWPEPDPPSDVIGFINTRDTSKPNQAHLQRSEMFETSQAVRFSSPFSMPKESLPDIATPRQFTAKHEEKKKLQPARDETKTEKSAVDGAQPTQLNAVPADVKGKEATGQKSPASGPKSDSDTTTTPNTEKQRHSNTPGEQDARTPRRASSKACTPDAGSPSHSTRPLPGSNANREAETASNTQRDVSDGTQAPHLRPPTDSDTEPNAESPTVNSHTSSSSTSVSSSSLAEKSHVSTATSRTISSSSPLYSPSIPPLTSSSTTPNPPLPSSSAAPSSTSTPPVPKPRTVQLVFKGDGDGHKLPEFSVVRKPETSTGVHGDPAVAAVPEIVPEPRSDSGGKTGAQKDADNAPDVGEAPRRKQSGTSGETKEAEEADGRHERAAMQLAAGNKAKSDVLITDAPKAESVNIQGTIPTDDEPKTLTSTDCRSTQQIACAATGRTEIKAPESSEVPNERSESLSERKTYLARAHVPQRISYSELTPKDADVSEIDSLKAPTHPVFVTHTFNSQSPQGDLSFTPERVTDGVPNTAKYNAHGAFHEQVPKAQASTHTPARPLLLQLTDTHASDFRSPTPERESRSFSALLRTPTPDGFLPRTPTPDSRTSTPDSRMHTPDPRTPDFQTPTSDGYLSSRADSALSNASEEYYECHDSPSHEPVFDRAAFRNHGTTDDHVSFSHANAPNATTIACAATLRMADRSGTISETESLSGPSSASSLSSFKEKMGEENVENGREEDESGERWTEGDYQATERRGSEDAKRTADHFKQGKESPGTEEENKEPQAPKRKKVLSQSAAGKPVALTNERTEPWRLSTGDLQLKKSSSERKRPDKAADGPALGPRGAERRDRPTSTGDTDGQKLLYTPLKTSRGQQRDVRAPSPSRHSRPPGPLSVNQASGPRPWGSKALPGSVQSADNTSSPRGSPSRPPPPVTAGAIWIAAGRERDEAARGRRGPVSRQPPAAAAAHDRTRAGPALNQHPPLKPEASQDQTVSPQEAYWQEEGKSPFSFTFSKLYSLKGLKEKIGKLPAQSKTDSASVHGPGRKTSS
ncbi:uncharacterized protein [Cebidichthys violaceus]|uniref:uncharacterized protein n=1 Tax=Cebidichthys violaceus TaxID=271503 RepID=UPI0035CA3561